MPETQFLSVSQHIIDCQIGSSIRFFVADPAAPGGWFRNGNRINTCSLKNDKAEVVKK